MAIQIPQPLKTLWNFGLIEYHVDLGKIFNVNIDFNISISPVQIIIYLLIAQTILERILALIHRFYGYGDEDALEGEHEHKE